METRSQLTDTELNQNLGTFALLPNEIIQKIVSLLTHAERYRFGGVAKAFEWSAKFNINDWITLLNNLPAELNRGIYEALVQHVKKQECYQVLTNKDIFEMDVDELLLHVLLKNSFSADDMNAVNHLANLNDVLMKAMMSKQFEEYDANTRRHIAIINLALSYTTIRYFLNRAVHASQRHSLSADFDPMLYNELVEISTLLGSQLAHLIAEKENACLRLHLPGVNLDCVEFFPKTDLRQADLRDANLSDCVLVLCDLRGAKLGDTDMLYANLSGSDLSEADLSRAYLTFATFENTNLTLANLSDARIILSHFEKACFKNANLTHTRFKDEMAGPSFLDNTDLSGAQFFDSAELMSDVKKALDECSSIIDDKNKHHFREAIASDLARVIKGLPIDTCPTHQKIDMVQVAMRHALLQDPGKRYGLTSWFKNSLFATKIKLCIAPTPAHHILETLLMELRQELRQENQSKLK